MHSAQVLTVFPRHARLVEKVTEVGGYEVGRLRYGSLGLVNSGRNSREFFQVLVEKREVRHQSKFALFLLRDKKAG